MHLLIRIGSIKHMKKVWGIIGLGWLGSELANKLKKQNQKTWGTHSQDFNFYTHTFPSTPYDVLLLNTPPLTQITPTTYAAKINTVPGSQIIFISSTSVYGNNKGLITESSVPEPKTESARWLVEVESALKNKFKKELTIIRPGGLIGGQRHPIFSLSRKNEIPNGDAVINLIHRLDLIDICIAAANERNIQLINAVAPYHPKKKDYYSQWASKLNLPKLNFLSGTESDRHIDSEILPTLHPKWICPNLDFL